MILSNNENFVTTKTCEEAKKQRRAVLPMLQNIQLFFMSYGSHWRFVSCEL
jgi:hypothetical protein